MTRTEFQKLAGRTVTSEQYKAIELLYINSNLDKRAFVNSIKAMLKSIPEEEEKKIIKKMRVRDINGRERTLNRMYYLIEYVEVIKVDMEAGKVVIRQLEENDFIKLEKQGCCLDNDALFDFDYEQCVDENGNPVTLSFE